MSYTFKNPLAEAVFGRLALDPQLVKMAEDVVLAVSSINELSDDGPEIRVGLKPALNDLSGFLQARLTLLPEEAKGLRQPAIVDEVLRAITLRFDDWSDDELRRRWEDANSLPTSE